MFRRVVRRLRCTKFGTASLRVTRNSWYDLEQNRGCDKPTLFNDGLLICVISGLHWGENRLFGLLGFTQRWLVVNYRHFGTTYSRVKLESWMWGRYSAWPSQMGRTSRPETLVANNQSTERNIPEEKDLFLSYLLHLSSEMDKNPKGHFLIQRGQGGMGLVEICALKGALYCRISMALLPYHACAISIKFGREVPNAVQLSGYDICEFRLFWMASFVKGRPWNFASFCTLLILFGKKFSRGGSHAVQSVMYRLGGRQSYIRRSLPQCAK